MKLELTYFGAAWCPPFEQIRLRVRALANKFEIPMNEYGIEDYGYLARKYGVTNAPAVVLDDGEGFPAVFSPANGSSVRLVEAMIEEELA